MIERLNFYDIYGYLLPGAALLAVCYLPFLLAGSSLPAGDWSSALISLILAYLLGHLIQILIRPVFDERPYPSDTLITEPGAFSAEFKGKLQGLLLEDFGLDVTKPHERETAFSACRYAVQSNAAPSYAEQHQGMYSMMRGLAGVSLLGAANQLGWIVRQYGVTHPHIATPILWGSLFALAAHAILDLTPRKRSIAVSKRRHDMVHWFWAVAASILWVGAKGYFVPVGLHADQTLLIICGVALAVAAMLFHRAFRHFQMAFAKAAYVTYFARRLSPLTHSPKKSD